jgi:hypothetical protein
MAGELETEQVDDVSLDDVISKALDSQAAEPAPVDDAPSDGRVRDATGRFVSRETTEGGPDAPAAEVAPEKTATEPGVQPETKVDGPKWTDGHFAGWKPEQRERFNALPPDVQELVMARQTENQAFFQRKLAEEGEFRKQAEPLYKAAQEVEPFARSIGETPGELMRKYAAIDQQLRYAPYAEKVKLLGEIAQSYGIPFAQPEPDPYADPLQPTGQAYPVIHDLQSKVRQLEAQVQTYQQQHTSLSQQQVASQIEAFAAATNADGTPSYPHFDVVKASMGQLMASGQASTLQEAYQLAAKPLEDRIAAGVEQRAKAAQAKQAEAVARAKKAAPVRSSGMSPGGTTKGGGLDAMLNQALASHGL